MVLGRQLLRPARRRHDDRPHRTRGGERSRHWRGGPRRPAEPHVCNRPLAARSGVGAANAYGQLGRRHDHDAAHARGGERPWKRGRWRSPGAATTRAPSRAPARSGAGVRTPTASSATAPRRTRSAPITVSGLGSGVAGVAAGSHHTCAVTTAGAVLCWGSNYSGQLGDGTTTDRHAPTAVSSLGSGVVAIAASTSHTCAVTDAGALWCWGWNAFGQVGDGTNTNKHVPTPVSGLGSGVASVASGWAHTCARTTAGALLCWGRNDSGQLGDGTTIDRPTPTAVSGLGSGVAIDRGRRVPLLRRDDCRRGVLLGTEPQRSGRRWKAHAVGRPRADGRVPAATVRSRPRWSVGPGLAARHGRGPVGLAA